MIFFLYNYSRLEVIVLLNPMELLTITILTFFLAHLAIGHVSFCHRLASVVIRRKLSHLSLLLWNPWTKLNQSRHRSRPNIMLASLSMITFCSFWPITGIVSNTNRNSRVIDLLHSVSLPILEYISLLKTFHLFPEKYYRSKI